MKILIVLLLSVFISSLAESKKLRLEKSDEEALWIIVENDLSKLYESDAPIFQPNTKATKEDFTKALFFSFKVLGHVTKVLNILVQKNKATFPSLKEVANVIQKHMESETLKLQLNEGGILWRDLRMITSSKLDPIFGSEVVEEIKKFRKSFDGTRRLRKGRKIKRFRKSHKNHRKYY